MAQPVVVRDTYQINTAVTGNSQNIVRLDPLAGGGMALAWWSNAGDISDSDVRRAFLKADGDPLTAPTTDEPLATSSSIDETDAVVAGLTDGRAVYVWEEEGVSQENNIYAQIRNADGTLLKGRFLLSSVTGGIGDDETTPEVIGLSNGNFAVSWNDKVGDEIVVKTFDIAGTEQSSAVVSTTAPHSFGAAPLTEIQDGRIVVTWLTEDTTDPATPQVKFAILESDGSLVLSETDTNPEDSATESDLGVTDVAALANGNFVLIFERGSDADDIQGRIFDADGNDVGARFSISTGSGSKPAVTALNDGRFVVVFERAADIFGQMMFADGTKDGAEFVVSNDPSQDFDADIATFADGRIMVSWQRGPTGSFDVFSKIYDPREVGLYGSATGLNDDWIGTEFIDTVFLGSGADTFDGGDSNDFVFGEGGNDALAGGEGSDTLNGGTGADEMIGGNGNDTYYVDSAGDTTDETGGSGIETVRSTVTHLLATDVEKLYLDGTGDIDGFGNGLSNYIFGNSGANILAGGVGADRLYGGEGDDDYSVDSSGDLIFETTAGAAGGIDFVSSFVNHTLSANVENLFLFNAPFVTNGTGNELVNEIFGSGGSNYIDGKAGSDFLTGSGGLDNFLFTTALGSTNIDAISDFTVADDTLRLDDAIFTALPTGYLAVAAFRIGTAAADVDDRIIYDSATGNVYYDRDGTGAVAKVQFATLDPGLAMTNADIFVF
ncbi:MAG: calcium-binding protein [Aestuariivirga sp.]